MLVALDTNILVYAEFEPDYHKGTLSSRILREVADRGVLSAQVLGEFLSVGRRRWPDRTEQAREQVELYRTVFEVPLTTVETLTAASVFAERYRLQFWD